MSKCERGRKIFHLISQTFFLWISPKTISSECKKDISLILAPDVKKIIIESYASLGEKTRSRKSTFFGGDCKINTRVDVL